VLAICASFRASSSVGSSGGLIITAQTNPYLCCPPSSCTYNSHVIRNPKFSSILYPHSQFLCRLASFKLSTLNVRYPSRIPSLLHCYSTRHSWNLTFCSCELPCRGAGCVLLHCFVVQPRIFTAVKCAHAAVIMFCSPVSTRCRIFLQL